MYDMPAEIDVKADGALRIITLNRPDELNAVNDPLHVGLAKIWEALNEDAGARAAVITGAGRAFSAGGDFNYLDELRNNEALRQKTIKHGRDLVIGMVRCRIPVIAAVNGPAVGLGCSLAALSDIVYMAETAFFADPHVQIGLVAADGGPLVWGSQISLLQAKEFALDGCADQGPAGAWNSGWPTMSSPTRWPRRSRAQRSSWSCPSRPSRPPSA